MGKKIAVPVNESGILDGHFGHCRYFAILTGENGKIIKEEMLIPPPHEPGLLPAWLWDMGVTDIIAGGMGRRAINLFNEKGVNAFVGAPRLSAAELVKDLLNGSLNLDANKCDQQHRCG